jgi:hypothetical protein
VVAQESGNMLGSICRQTTDGIRGHHVMDLNHGIIGHKNTPRAERLENIRGILRVHGFGCNSE